MLNAVQRTEQGRAILETEEGKRLNICGYKVVTDTGEEVGSVNDFVADTSGRIRYLVIDTGFWIFGKKILVPVGMVDVNDERRVIVISGMTKEQAERLPAYDESRPIDERYEAAVIEGFAPGYRQKGEYKGVEYEKMPQFTSPERIRLLEEHLVVDKHREKKGEVHLRKTVETHTETVEVPVTEERLVIEHHPVSEAETAEEVAGEAMRTVEMREGEEINVPLYKEEVDVTRRTVPAEEVTVRKTEETTTRNIREDVKKEHLDVDNPEHLDIEERGGEKH